MSCAQTGYNSTATFHTKVRRLFHFVDYGMCFLSFEFSTAACLMRLQPFYGGKIHRVTADVKSPQGDVVCRVSGEWNGSLEFTDANVSVK